MIFDSIFNHVLFLSIALTLLHFLWQGLAVGLILACLLKIIDNQHSRLRYACSSFAMVLNLILPFITFFIIQQPQKITLLNQANFSTNHLLGLTSLPEKISFSENLLLSSLPYLTVIWLIVIFYLAVRLLYQMAIANQLPKRGVSPPELALDSMFKNLISRLGITQNPTLLISFNIDVPMAVGWIKPVVLLPASMLTGLTSSQLEMLLLHELAHIRRYDYLANLLQSIVEILLFFHPAVFWVSKQMRIEREYCSDDIAVQHCGDAMAYAHTLADTASLCNKHRHAIPAMAMAASGGDLKQRVLRLVSQHHCVTGYDRSKWLAAITVVSLLFLFTSMQVPHINVIDNNYSQQNTLFKKHIIQPNNEIWGEVKDYTAQKNNQKINDNITQISKISLQYDLAIEILNHINSEDEQTIQNELHNTNHDQFIESASSYSTTTKKSTQARASSKNNRINEYPLIDSLTTPIKNSDPISQFEQKKQRKSTANTTNLHLNKNASTSQNLNEMPNKPVYKLAEIISMVQPNYPSSAERKKVQMNLIVNFSIDKQGNISNIEIENKKKSHYFKTAIRNAIKKWKVLPAERDGQPVNSTMTKIFSFNLKTIH